MRMFLLFPVLILAACGGAKDAKQEEPRRPTGPMAGASGAADCPGLPVWVAIERGAPVTSCHHGQTGPHRESGVVEFNSMSPPDFVIQTYRETAARAGLKPGGAMGGSFSATAGNARSIMVMTRPGPKGVGTTVTVNWGQEI